MNSNWIFLSKDGQDEYINMMAKGAGGKITNTDDFVYESSQSPIVLRGILKHKIMQRCWQDGRDFYYVDTGYFGNNRPGKKVWHRIVRNDLQHDAIVERPSDRWQRFGIKLQPRRHGRRIIVALPDEKPCRFYGIDRDQWINQTVAAIKAHTDRPIVLRERAPNRLDRVVTDPLRKMLEDDVHALVTFNSVAAIESILAGVPAFVLAPTHAASPVANRDLAQIESPHWADSDKLHAWCCHLAYGQFHVSELKSGQAYRMLNAH